MLSPKGEEFLDDVLSFIKFPFDRATIRKELESHLQDKIEDYIEQGYDEEAAEQLSISNMGEAKEIGTELNREHNPFVGWLWMLTRTAIILLIVINVFIAGVPVVMSLFRSNLVNDIPKSNIVYSIKVDKKVQLDDTVIDFTDVILEKNGQLDIFYEYYDTRLWGTGWSLGDIGTISDNLGNVYFSGSGYGQGGIKSQNRRIVDHFSSEATTLIISYNRFNRKYGVEIPLKAGDQNE